MKLIDLVMWCASWLTRIAINYCKGSGMLFSCVSMAMSKNMIV